MLEAKIFAISEESVQSSTTDTREVDPHFSCFTAYAILHVFSDDDQEALREIKDVTNIVKKIKTLQVRDEKPTDSEN